MTEADSLKIDTQSGSTADIKKVALCSHFVDIENRAPFRSHGARTRLRTHAAELGTVGARLALVQVVDPGGVVVEDLASGCLG